MTDFLTLRLQDNLLEVSYGAGQPLPATVAATLAANMRYVHVRHLRGLDRYDPLTGETRNIELEPRLLHRIDARGRLLCGAGYLPRVQRLASQLGLRCVVGDFRRAPSHPDAYTPDFDYMLRFIEPRAVQEDFLAAIVNAERGAISAPPGFGKSYGFLAAASLYRRAKHAIVIPDIDNTCKTVRLLRQHFAQVGQIGGGKHTVAERLNVYTLGSFHYYPGDADFVWADEVHRMLSPSGLQTLGYYMRGSRNFCLSATLESRADKAHAHVEPLFGPLLYSLTYQEAVAAGLILPIRVIWSSCRHLQHPAPHLSDPVARKRRVIWYNRERNALIAEIAQRYPADVQLLIIVETISHALQLQQLLPDYELCYGSFTEQRLASAKAAGEVPDDFVPLSRASREDMRIEFEQGRLRKVIATDVWSTGVSFNALRVLIRADARASSTLDLQIPGRTSRIDAGSDKTCGIVHDLMDQFDEGFCRAATSRRASYKRHGWTQQFPFSGAGRRGGDGL